MGSVLKLPLTAIEKSKLRRAKVKLSEIHTFNNIEIAQLLEVPVDKAKVIKGLADFQQVPSIGYHLAEKLVYKLELYSLTDIRDKNAVELFDTLEQKLGVWTDSCVEDQIRCVIHFANNPGSDKHWYDFTSERKNYRKSHGFPRNRPTIAWYDSLK
ncbi:helix-hairpin-helix domain-containing protein [Ornithinibacillus scapharcae]|uniref:helix-hairpin-helix domain-containing protein n=1 Tax=Ornithinibacillus scapharcae TaxID=1147159 RepID=UPI000225AABE|nr:helix-hairpin-helix domain-containing protein [Ornithinibacillus scapharcae]